MEKILSPGVYTYESDNSYITPGTTLTVGAFIGTAEKGPAFLPVDISSPSEFYTVFGSNENDYLAPAVTKYLSYAGGAKVVRVLYENNWSGSNEVFNFQLSSGSITDSAFALAKSSAGVAGAITLSSYNTGSGDFIITSGGIGVTASLNPASSMYIEKVFGTNPYQTAGTGLASQLYVYKNYKTFTDSFYSGSSRTLTTSSIGTFLMGIYSNAETPWITSQMIGSEAYNLFKFETIDHGTSANKLYKILIDSVTISTDPEIYSTFNVIVKDYVTNNVLESYSGLNLDPASSNYILNRIGDRVITIDSTGRIVTTGDYENKSKYIRVVSSTNIDKMPYNVYPFGHTAYSAPISGSVYAGNLFIAQQGTADVYDSSIAWGIDLTKIDAQQLPAPLQVNTNLIVSGGINLSNYQTHVSSGITPRKYLYESGVPAEMKKFEVVFQGGFDGIAPYITKNYGGDISSTNVFGFDCSTSTSTGTVSFKKAIDSLSNKDEHDINLLAIPGLLHGTHTSVTSYAMQMVQNRADVFYIFDSSKLDDSISTVLSNVESIDNNYVGTYYPWVKISTVNNGKIKNLWIPPSVIIPSVYAFNDKVGAEWYAPAGLTRGGLDVTDVKRTLSQDDRDTLYNGRVNPIAKFPAQGISAQGQKTCQKKASSLDRINVRRLLIAAKKYVSKVGRLIVFDPNTNKTRNAFLAAVNPYFENVKSRQGVYAFRVVMDETNNTPDVIDRNYIIGQIYLQPTKAGEFIQIGFNLQPTGVTFS
ncbi:MAG TPA: phage tail sheath subtilisin-like domain-containing protein [Thermotogota bacterium]|nr:phage tail sheath subtilisin-like domain-containing protein [Thermotogota bacterium]